MITGSACGPSSAATPIELIGFVGLSVAQLARRRSRRASRSAGGWPSSTGATASRRRPRSPALDWGFAQRRPARTIEIVSFTTEGNINSQRVMEKIGMVHDPDGDFDHPLLPDWVDRRHVLYRIDRQQYDEHVAR